MVPTPNSAEAPTTFSQRQQGKELGTWPTPYPQHLESETTSSRKAPVKLWYPRNGVAELEDSFCPGKKRICGHLRGPIGMIICPSWEIPLSFLKVEILCSQFLLLTTYEFDIGIWAYCEKRKSFLRFPGIQERSTWLQWRNEGGLPEQKKEDEETGVQDHGLAAQAGAKVMCRWQKIKHESGYIQLHRPLGHVGHVGLLLGHCQLASLTSRYRSFLCHGCWG